MRSERNAVQIDNPNNPELMPPKTLYYRGAIISVYVDDSWLTNGGEVSLEDGWAEAWRRLRKSLHCDNSGIRVVLERWGGGPEPASPSEKQEIQRQGR